MFVTDFADLAVLLPVAGAVAVILFLLGWGRGALSWSVVVGVTLIAVLLLKLTVFACGADLARFGLASPSGHTAGATMVYGGLLALLFTRLRGWSGALLIGGSVAAVFASSRLLLHVHSVADVSLGATVGLAGILALIRLAGDPPAQLRAARTRLVLPLGVAVAAIMLLFHGQRLGAEAEIHYLARTVWPFSECRPQS